MTRIAIKFCKVCQMFIFECVHVVYSIRNSKFSQMIFQIIFKSMLFLDYYTHYLSEKPIWLCGLNEESNEWQDEINFFFQGQNNSSSSHILVKNLISSIKFKFKVNYILCFVLSVIFFYKLVFIYKRTRRKSPKGWYEDVQTFYLWR